MNKETLRALLGAIEALKHKRENLYRASRMFERNKLAFDSGEYSRIHADIVAAKMELVEIIRRKLDLGEFAPDEEVIATAQQAAD